VKRESMLDLSKHLFWDLDFSKLDLENDIHIILERVFTRGTESDEKAVINYYGIDKIKVAARDIKYIDKITLSNWKSVTLLKDKLNVLDIKAKIINELKKIN
jgi:hypothetical protein